MRKATAIVLMALVAGAILSPGIFRAHADGFGITPPYVRNNSLTQNSHYEQTIILVRSSPDQDLTANVTINVPNANSWISIDKGTQFTLPKGTQQMPMIVSVNVPSDAKLGEYTGNIQVVVSPLTPPTAGTVGVTIGAQIDVDLKVIDQKTVNFKVHRVTMTNTEEGSSWLWMHFPGKILFTMDLQNIGNIPGSPYKVTFQYSAYLSGQVLETEDNTNAMATVKPFESKSVVAEMPTYLPQGSYKVFYEIFGRDSGDIIGEGNLDLSVLPHGTLAGYIAYDFWGIRWPEKLITFAIIAAILIVVWLLFALVRSRFVGGPRRGRRGGDYNRVFEPPPRPGEE